MYIHYIQTNFNCNFLFFKTTIKEEEGKYPKIKAAEEIKKEKKKKNAASIIRIIYTEIK